MVNWNRGTGATERTPYDHSQVDAKEALERRTQWSRETTTPKGFSRPSSAARTNYPLGPTPFTGVNFRPPRAHPKAPVHLHSGRRELFYFHNINQVVVAIIKPPCEVPASEVVMVEGKGCGVGSMTKHAIS
mmetsp:Transcript_112/g.268  ORF Transcript_112/g.268 Transcript_112/m.268 type:complete len:131 (+) Transcript_112:167-559(+)